MERFHEVIVIGGGHAGVEAAWSAANLLPGPRSVALVTLDPTKIGVMSCNPAIGGLAKGQLVREVDALGGLMALAADATGIMFKVLNASRGQAVRGPRAQCDKHAYAHAVQDMIASRAEIDVIAGSVEAFRIERGRAVGVRIIGEQGEATLKARAVVLTTGTFMRGLMHMGETRTAGGRFGEGAAVGISAALRGLGFELGRLKTGTPPRLRKGSLDWESLPAQEGDAEPAAFSSLSGIDEGSVAQSIGGATWRAWPSLRAFPVLPQVQCRVTATNADVHAVIRENLHRAPMYSGQIESAGPRYCPSIEDKVVRFGERDSHHVFLEPESLRDDWVYCNGISTSLPPDVQDHVVRGMKGCERAEILRYGYAVEYDMVRPHQIHATGMTKIIEGLFLAGQINGTSGYEEAAGQGLIAGINAAKWALGGGASFAGGEFLLGRHEAYIGVMMDDLVCKTPVEPYRMFTSRAEHRLMLRADNADDRLTPLAHALGLLDSTPLGRLRVQRFARRRRELSRIAEFIASIRVEGVPLSRAARRPEFSAMDLRRCVEDAHPQTRDFLSESWLTAHADLRYESYVVRARAEVRRSAEMERKTIPHDVDYASFVALRTEARGALARFRPATFGQAARLEGVTPADLTLLSVLLRRRPHAAPEVAT